MMHIEMAGKVLKAADGGGVRFAPPIVMHHSLVFPIVAVETPVHLKRLVDHVRTFAACAIGAVEGIGASLVVLPWASSDIAAHREASVWVRRGDEARQLPLSYVLQGRGGASVSCGEVLEAAGVSDSSRCSILLDTDHIVVIHNDGRVDRFYYEDGVYNGRKLLPAGLVRLSQ